MTVIKVNIMPVETLNASPFDAPSSHRPQDRQLDDGLERVFQKYGSDLSAFLKDVTDEVTPKSENLKLASSYARPARR
jgi:hypothetical protein